MYSISCYGKHIVVYITWLAPSATQFAYETIRWQEYMNIYISGQE